MFHQKRKLEKVCSTISPQVLDTLAPDGEKVRVKGDTAQFLKGLVD
jgi:hypothetical protein